MGGVDLLDAMVAVYRVPFRKRKWWFPFHAWSLSVCAVNGWRLRQKHTGKKEPYLTFLRELVIGMLYQHGSPTKRVEQMTGILGIVRYDCLNHWIVQNENDSNGQPRRRNCKQCTLNGKRGNKTVYMCEKCSVPLHTHCFKNRNVFLHIFYEILIPIPIISFHSLFMW